MEKVKKLAKFLCILYIIFAICDVLMTIACVLTMTKVISVETLAVLDKTTLRGSMALYTAKTALYAIIEMYFGIMGLKYLKSEYTGDEHLKSAKLFLVVEAICVVLAVVGIIAGNDEWSVLMTIIANSVVLLLYINCFNKVKA